ncbi:hypothetical protein [Thalassotalea sp. SU-HH00458]|uniref:hypothetical protein n=1 Tax=Thalassotalea sp. SU-HH00458 TaxID=3127657 RepID=UPI003105DAE2
MKINAKVKLRDIPEFSADTVITTRSDGLPRSRIYDETWIYSGQEARAVGQPFKVSFKNIDLAYREGIQRALGVISDRYEVKHHQKTTCSQIQRWKNGLIKIATALNSCNWASLSDDNVFSSFTKQVVKGLNKKSETTVDEVVTAIKKLHEYGLCMRLIDRNSLRKFVELRPTKQHIAIPIGMYQPILASAIQLFELYQPFIHEIDRVMKEARLIREAEKNRKELSQKTASISQRTLIKTKLILHDIPDFKILLDGTVLNRILTNCSIVAIAFSGMRLGEMLSMSINSYKTVISGKDNDIPVIKGETSKGNDGVPRVTTWQTHPVVKDALELAYGITEHLRNEYVSKVEQMVIAGELSNDDYQHALREINSAFISTLPDKIDTRFIISGMERRFNDSFAESGIVASQNDVEEFNRLNPTREGELKVGGKLPKLTPHDLRRTFAVFFKRYGFGSSATIKFQYKHQNINMSNYYANNAQLQAMEDILMDTELLELMEEEGIRMGVDIFDEIYNESDNLSGAGGDRIAQDKFEKLENGHLVYMNRDEIERLVRNGTLSVVKLPTGGYCLNASCSRVCGIGEFPGEIKPCDHQVVTDKEAKKVLRQNKRLISSFRELNTGDTMMNSILIGMKHKIKRNEITIKKHDLNFEEFNDAIKGVIATSEV